MAKSVLLWQHFYCKALFVSKLEVCGNFEKQKSETIRLEISFGVNYVQIDCLLHNFSAYVANSMFKLKRQGLEHV